MAEPLDEPLRVVARDELADDAARLGEILEAMEIDALLLERAHEALDHAVALRLADVRRAIVIPSHFTSLIQASAMYCGPQSHRIRSPRATSFANRPKRRPTPCRSGSWAAPRAPLI